MPARDFVHMRKEQWSSGEPIGKGPTMATTLAPSTSVRKVIGETELLWMMALLMALNAFGIDAILPALDELAVDLGVDGNARQFVIGVYLLTAGIGALLPGALADRFGGGRSCWDRSWSIPAVSCLGAIAPTCGALIVVRAAQRPSRPGPLPCSPRDHPRPGGRRQDGADDEPDLRDLPDGARRCPQHRRGDPAGG